MEVTTMERMLTVMRHAKSSWSTGEADQDRPLSPRGRRDAAAAARAMTGAGLAFDLVCCSVATRTRQTWDVLASGGVQGSTVEYVEDLYEASPATMYTVVRDVPVGLRRVLVLGHQPTVELFVRTAAGPVDDVATGLAAGFRTSSFAVLSVPTTWADFDPHTARLVTFQTPRG
jgi:phosphohistidine phosphatase